MAVRRAEAEWKGTLQEGAGSFSVESGAFGGTYTFGTRFGEDPGTNPEELVGASHAACFSMALSAELGGAGFTPESIRTTASVTVERLEEGFTITGIELETEAHVPGIDDERFQQLAEAAKTGCPVSKALAAVPIGLRATLAG